MGLGPGFRNRSQRNHDNKENSSFNNNQPKSILKNKSSYSALNKSVLKDMDEKSNTKLFYDVSKGYFENLAISFRRVLANVG